MPAEMADGHRYVLQGVRKPISRDHQLDVFERAQRTISAMASSFAAFSSAIASSEPP